MHLDKVQWEIDIGYINLEKAKRSNYSSRNLTHCLHFKRFLNIEPLRVETAMR